MKLLNLLSRSEMKKVTGGAGASTSSVCDTDFAEYHVCYNCCLNYYANTEDHDAGFEPEVWCDKLC